MNAVPGSATIGARRQALVPATTLGMPEIFSHSTRSPFQNQYPSPEVWVISCLTVAWLAGGRSCGTPFSKPVSTCTSANSGQ